MIFGDPDVTLPPGFRGSFCGPAGAVVGGLMAVLES